MLLLYISGDAMTPSKDNSTDLVPQNPIRTETALSKYPVHNLSKRGKVEIEICQKDESGAAVVKWEVSYNSRFGQPGQQAYKLDTLVINRRIEEAGRPVPKVLRLGSLREICRELGLNEGQATRDIRRSLFQNASAFINAKVTYHSLDGQERYLEAGFTRYTVILRGDRLPDGRTADAVYLVLNDVYLEVLNQARTRPLDYDYLKELPPAAQRFYEIVSYEMYAALKNRSGNYIEKEAPRARKAEPNAKTGPRLKLMYSRFCLLSTLTRHFDYDHVKKQMHKIHAPHRKSEYLNSVEFEATVDADGQPDWVMWYTPGPKARLEYEAFVLRRRAPKMQGSLFADEELDILDEPEDWRALEVAVGGPSPAEFLLPPEPEPESDETVALAEILAGEGVNQADALRLARDHPEHCRTQLEYLPYVKEFTSSRGAYLRTAIEKGFGPPKGYEEAKAKAEARRREEDRTRRDKARQSHEEAHQEAFFAYLRCREGEVRETAPEAFAAFLEAEQRSRGQFQRMRAKRLLAEWDTEPAHLRRFQDAFKGEVLDFWAWDAHMNPHKLA